MNIKKHGYSSEAQRRANPEPEHLHKTAAPRYSYHTPESEFPHKTHDLSDLSQHYLDTTAFLNGVSMGTPAFLGLHGNKPDLDIAKTYALISAKIPISTWLTKNSELIDHSTIDFDYQGILCETAGRHLVVVQEPPSEATGNKTRRRIGWSPKDLIGKHLFSEWESIPKKLIGEYCIVATGSTEGWWQSHSEIIMQVRQMIAQHLPSIFELKLPVDKVMARVDVIARAAAEFVYRGLEEQEERKAKAAESAMREFTTLDDE
jgi:hypothetical protein